MDNTDDILESYIQQVFKIQQEHRQKPLNQADLNRIAQELGLSDEEIRSIHQKFDDYLARGKGYSRYEDWDSAIQEFKLALVLNPSHVEALYGIANALKNRWILKKNKEDLNQAKHYVKQALQTNPNHDESFRLASELNRGVMQYSKSKHSKPVEPLNPVQVNFQALSPSDRKKLKKSLRDRKISGVCGGIAEYFNIDPTIVRLTFLLGALSGFGSPLMIPAYIIMSIILPDR